MPPTGVIPSVQPAICWNIRVSRTTHRAVRKGVYDSDNVTGADNQQERLIRIGWVVGFVDGEGCFSIGFVRQARRTGRAGYGTGYQVVHRFVVPQAEGSRSALEELASFFGVGCIYLNRRNDNHHQDQLQYRVSARFELLERIIPFFQQHPLRTSKRRDFETFVRCMDVVAAERHLTRDGLVEIAEMAETMNHRRSRSDLIRILRGHTPATSHL